MEGNHLRSAPNVGAVIVLAFMLALLTGLASFAIASATWSSSQNASGLVNAWSEPQAVGGIAELPDVAQGPASEANLPADSSDSPTFPYSPVAGGVAAVVILTAAAWYARRRWGR